MVLRFGTCDRTHRRDTVCGRNVQRFLEVASNVFDSLYLVLSTRSIQMSRRSGLLLNTK